VWIFFIFSTSTIRVNPTDIVSSLPPTRCRLSSGRHRHATAPCHAFFPLSQDKLAVSVSSFNNSSSRPLSSRNWSIEFIPPPQATLLKLPKLPPSLTRAPRHQSSTRRHCSLSPLSHVHRHSTQQHPWWRTSRPSFVSWIAYQHVSSCKKIF
jgi:hypothetical protein